MTDTFRRQYRPLADVENPEGDGNRMHILASAGVAKRVVACWGAEPLIQKRAEHLVQFLTERGIVLHALRLTRGGCPSHPLYLPAYLQPIRWKP